MSIYSTLKITKQNYYLGPVRLLGRNKGHTCCQAWGPAFTTWQSQCIMGESTLRVVLWTACVCHGIYASHIHTSITWTNYKAELKFIYKVLCKVI